MVTDHLKAQPLPPRRSTRRKTPRAASSISNAQRSKFTQQTLSILVLAAAATFNPVMAGSALAAVAAAATVNAANTDKKSRQLKPATALKVSCSDLQPPHRTARAFGSTSHLPPAPKGFCYCSVIIDNGATITCQNTADNCHSIQHVNTTLETAVKGQPINIEHQGIGSVLTFDHRGRPHRLCMGKAIIDPSLRNLCSPSAMLL
jgi:hypothetical protein